MKKMLGEVVFHAPLLPAVVTIGFLAGARLGRLWAFGSVSLMGLPASRSWNRLNDGPQSRAGAVRQV